MEKLLEIYDKYPYLIDLTILELAQLRKECMKFPQDYTAVNAIDTLLKERKKLLDE